MKTVLEILRKGDVKEIERMDAEFEGVTKPKRRFATRSELNFLKRLVPMTEKEEETLLFWRKIEWVRNLFWYVLALVSIISGVILMTNGSLMYFPVEQEYLLWLLLVGSLVCMFAIGILFGVAIIVFGMDYKRLEDRIMEDVLEVNRLVKSFSEGSV